MRETGVLDGTADGVHVHARLAVINTVGCLPEAGRERRHENIAARFESVLLPPCRIKTGKGCCGRHVEPRRGQPQHGHDAQRQRNRAVRRMRQRGCALRDERPDAAHGRPHVPRQQDVVGQRFRLLTRNADEKAGAQFITEVCQRFLSLSPLLQRIAGMQGGVQPGIGCFMPDQETVCAGLLPERIPGAGLFAYAQGDGQSCCGLNGRNNLCQPFGIATGLSRLQDNSIRARRGGRARRGQDILFFQTVAAYRAVFFSQAAVETVAAADIGKFNESAHEDVLTHIFATCLPSRFLQFLPRHAEQQFRHFRARHVVRLIAGRGRYFGSSV